MKKIGILFLILGLVVLMSAFAAADTVLIDFESLTTGSSVEGMGAVHSNLDISCPGTGTVIEEGTAPYAYDANRVNNNDFKNGCLDGIKGFANTASAPPYERGDFTFEFDGTVSSFSVEMYDYGDYNPLRHRYMVMTITAYDQFGAVVDSDSINWDVSSQTYPYPNKDACAKGNPNHYTWVVSGEGIAKIVLDMVSGPDPGVGFDNMQFELEEAICDSETTELIAGGGNPKSAIDVGEVTVSSDGETLEVTYTVDVEGWEITETHLDVECEVEDIPQTQPNKKGIGGGNPIPGQFDYVNYFDPGVTEYTVSINLDDICCTDPVIAAHAVVRETICDENLMIYGIERDTGTVYWVNMVENTFGVEFDIVPPPSTTGVTPNGLAYDSVNSRWYYNDYREDGDRTNNKLYFHDGISQTLAGSLPYEIAAGGFDNGKYYFIDSYPATDDLYEVTLNSDGTINTITKVADISNNAHAWTFNGDIAVKNGIVYGWGRNGNTYEFFKVNVDGTGFTYNVPGYQLSLQLAFGSDGILYGHRSDRSGGPWFVVPTTDGEVNPADPVSSPGVSFTDAASGGLCVPKTETAWGDGPDFPGKNWAMYFDYDLSECYEPDCPVEGIGGITGLVTWISNLLGGGQ